MANLDLNLLRLSILIVLLKENLLDFLLFGYFYGEINEVLVYDHPLTSLEKTSEIQR